MKFRVSTQMSPVSRTAVEVIEFVDIDEFLTLDEVDTEASKLEKRFEGSRIGACGSLTLRKGSFEKTVTVTVTELSEAEADILRQADIENRRHASGYTYGEWELISRGGPGTITRGIRHPETPNVHELPILNKDNKEVDRIRQTALTTVEVRAIVAQQIFEKWIDEKLYADDPEKLIELLWDDDYPYQAVGHLPECLPHISRDKKRRFYSSDKNGGIEWDIEGILTEIPLKKCKGCKPPPAAKDDTF